MCVCVCVCVCVRACVRVFSFSFIFLIIRSIFLKFSLKVKFSIIKRINGNLFQRNKQKIKNIGELGTNKITGEKF